MELIDFVDEIKTITLVDILNYLEKRKGLKTQNEAAAKLGLSPATYSNMKNNKVIKLNFKKWNNIMFDYMIYRCNDSSKIPELGGHERTLNPKIDWVNYFYELEKQLRQIDNEEIKKCLTMLKIYEDDDTYTVWYKGKVFNSIEKTGRTHIIHLSNILLDFLSQIEIILEKEKNNEMIKEEYGQRFKIVMKAYECTMNLKSNMLWY